MRAGLFTGVGRKDSDAAGWIPYPQVDDVDAAINKAQRLAAKEVGDVLRRS